MEKDARTIIAISLIDNWAPFRLYQVSSDNERTTCRPGRRATIDRLRKAAARLRLQEGPVRQSARAAAGLEKPDDAAERRAERNGDDHRERPAPQDHQARGSHQAVGQQIGLGRGALAEDPARPDAEPRGAGALFRRPATPVVGPDDEEVLAQ